MPSAVYLDMPLKVDSSESKLVEACCYALPSMLTNTLWHYMSLHYVYMLTDVEPTLVSRLIIYLLTIKQWSLEYMYHNKEEMENFPKFDLLLSILKVCFIFLVHFFTIIHILNPLTNALFLEKNNVSPSFNCIIIKTCLWSLFTISVLH